MLPPLAALRALADSKDGLATGVALTAAATLAVLAFKALASGQGKKPTIESIPMPESSLPVLGSTWDVLKNFDNFHEWVYEQCRHFQGKPWRMRVLGHHTDIVVISDLQGFEDVVKTQYSSFGKGDHLREVVGDFLGQSMVVVDGETWRFQRKALVSLFSANDLRDNVSVVIRDCAFKVAGVFDRAAARGEPVDFFGLMNTFTLEAFTEVAFGYKMGSLETGEPHPLELAYDRVDDRCAERYSLPVWFWKLQRFFSLGAEGQLKRDMALINTTVLAIIRENLEMRARGEKSNKKDYITLALNAATEGELQDPEELLSMAVGLIVAARGGVAQSLSYLTHFLAQNPRVEAKLRAELHAKLPALMASKDTFPTSDEVGDLVYLEACIKETLRFYSSGAFNVKEALEDTFLSDGTFLSKGTQCVISGYAMGRLENIWGPDALEFRPERFLDEETGKLINMPNTKFTFFLAGPRYCPGRTVAMMQIKIIMAGLLSRYKFTEVAGQNVTYRRAITIPMRDPFMVHAERL